MGLIFAVLRAEALPARLAKDDPAEFHHQGSETLAPLPALQAFGRTSAAKARPDFSKHYI